MGLSYWHILLVLVVFVLLFGAGRISSLMGDIAKGLKSFNKAMADDDEEGRPEEKLIEHSRANRTSRSRRVASRTETARSRKTG